MPLNTTKLNKTNENTGTSPYYHFAYYQSIYCTRSIKLHMYSACLPLKENEHWTEYENRAMKVIGGIHGLTSNAEILEL